MDSSCLNARPREAPTKTSAWEVAGLLDDADGTPKPSSLKAYFAGVNHLA
jgi:hypothetical protein